MLYPHIAKSNVPSANGIRVPSPQANALMVFAAAQASPTDFTARASSAGVKSNPTTKRIRAASALVNVPGPQAKSSARQFLISAAPAVASDANLSASLTRLSSAESPHEFPPP